MRKVLIFLLPLALLFSCGSGGNEHLADISDIDLELDFEDLTGDMHLLETEEQLAAFLAENPAVRDDFFKDPQYPSQQQMLTQTLDLLRNPYVDTLYNEVRRLIDVDKLKNDLENAYKHIKYFYPDFEPPKVRTVYSGFGKDIFFSDSLLVIGLDYYLGPEARFRPDEYEYLKVRLTPDHLVPQIIQFTSNKFNETNMAQRTILDEMVFYGKALHFTKRMLPDTPDSLIMGYSAAQINNAEVSEGYLWAYFVEKALLYDKQPLNIAKYIEERPSIPEIDRICPGRIGQWLGWQILQAYEEETGEGFREVMTKTDATELLTLSRYKPRIR